MGSNIFRLRASVAPEDDEAEALAKALGYAIGPPGIITPHHVLWYAIEHKSQLVQERARRARIGCVPGIPDICIRWWCKAYHIELKRRRGGVVRDTQHQMHDNLRALGDAVAVCEGWEAALRQVKRWGIPMRTGMAL